VRVQRGGLFSWCGSSYFVGVPLAGVHIGVETLDLLHVRAWLGLSTFLCGLQFLICALSPNRTWICA
jgi:hypothetical protein